MTGRYFQVAVTFVDRSGNELHAAWWYQLIAPHCCIDVHDIQKSGNSNAIAAKQLPRDSVSKANFNANTSRKSIFDLDSDSDSDADSIYSGIRIVTNASGVQYIFQSVMKVRMKSCMAFTLRLGCLCPGPAQKRM